MIGHYGITNPTLMTRQESALKPCLAAMIVHIGQSSAYLMN